jgi:hypothetical protein
MALSLVAFVVLAGCGGRDAATRGAAPTTTTAGAGSGSSTTTAPPMGTPATTSTVARLTTTSAGPGTVPFAAASGVHGTVVFGPVCPVERNPPDPLCAPRPGPARIDLVGSDGRSVSGEAGADGRFSIPAGPGTYEVRASAISPGPGGGCRSDPARVTVVGGSSSPVAVTCDTGIR